MTVAELMDVLAQVPADAEISIEIGESGETYPNIAVMTTEDGKGYLLVAAMPEPEQLNLPFDKEK